MLVNRKKFMTKSTLIVTKVVNSLVMFDITSLAFFAVKRTGFPTERAAVGVWVVAVNFAYCGTLEASYGRFWRHPAISGTHTPLHCCSVSTEPQLTADASEFAGRFHTRSLTCQPSPKRYFVSLLGTLQTSNTFYDYAPCRGMAGTLTVFDRSRHTPESRKPLKSLSSPHGTITENCSEHFMRFRCSFPEFETKVTQIR
jgi:hypothetical protein